MHGVRIGRLVVLVVVGTGNWASHGLAQGPPTYVNSPASTTVNDTIHDERPSDAWMPGPRHRFRGGVAEPSVWTRGPWRSIQVNVDALGQNIVGDAANEPSIAIDPTDPCKMAIGWRQFDNVESSFRQAGWGYSHDKGETWVFTGSLEPGTFGSDPVLDFDAEGGFYYLSMGYADLRLFRSFDGGVTWTRTVAEGLGFADKPWMGIDRTDGIGRGNVYVSLRYSFTRSTDGGSTFVEATEDLDVGAGTVSVGPGGEVYAAGGRLIKESLNAQDPEADPTFERIYELDYREPCIAGQGIRDISLTARRDSVGSPCTQLYCQSGVATDHSMGLSHGNVYGLFCQQCTNIDQNEHIIFTRSTDGGVTWDPPRRVNDDPTVDHFIWHWFNTMSVAPNGRIDVVWNDARNTGAGNLAELFYAYSTDAGETWSTNRPVSPMFDSCIGRVGKLGDYYGMISDNAVANVAYAATFNGEHDVYFLRLGDCNDNGIHDSQDVADGTAYDCNENALLDECELGDADGNEQINLRDFAHFANCFTGSIIQPLPHGRGSDRRDTTLTSYTDPCCGIMDFDTDGDVDLDDFATFHVALTP